MVDEDAAVARIGDTVCCAAVFFMVQVLHCTFLTPRFCCMSAESCLAWPAASNSHKTFETLALLVSKLTMRNGRCG